MIRLKPLNGFLLAEAERMLGFDVEGEDHPGDATNLIGDESRGVIDETEARE
jgi:hypothetical protein